VANPYPAEFLDDQGEARLTGSVDFTDPSNQPGGAPGVTWQSGTGDPNTASVPGTLGSLYSDTEDGGIFVYTAGGWVIVGGQSDNQSLGITSVSAGGVKAAGTAGGSVVFLNDGSGNMTAPGVIATQAGFATEAIASGALPTTGAWSSGTAVSLDGNRDVTMAFDFVTDGTANAASCDIALSPDDSTFSTVASVGASVQVNTVGAVTLPATVQVPKGWYVQLTFSHGTPSVGTYW